MKLLKKLMVLVLLVLTVFITVGCKKKESGDGSEKTKVGILQLVTHGALDQAREGFIAGLKDAGFEDGKNIEITVKNPEADTATMTQMAQELVRTCDLVLAIATPAAIAVQSAANTLEKDIPILFTAVTDAVDAQLVASNENPGGNITGTSDMNPVAAQVDLIKELIPGIKKFGIIYNVSEPNSLVQANLAKAEAEKQGLTVIEKTVTEANAIVTTANQVVSEGAEAFYLPTDNLIASNMPAIAQVCEDKKIPTICGEESMVVAGGTITYGVNYFNLGKQTAGQAAKILKGEKAGSIPVGFQPDNELSLAVNEEMVAKIGLVIPESIKERMSQETKIKDGVKIGILQLVTHGALDNAREGFIAGLKDAGLIDGQNCEIIVKNPEADTATMTQMAQDLIRTCDIVLAIATPAAIALQSAAATLEKNTPILFTAVTDAVDAQLVASNENPGGNITGTSDMNPVADQVDLFKELVNGITTFGIIYSASEPNSLVQANLAKAEAEKQGLTVIEKTVADAAGISTATRQLISDGAQALYIPTDNLIASNMPAVVQVCEELKVPTVCGEESLVTSGGTITYGVNYFNLGKQTAAQAILILTGTNPGTIPVGTQPASELSITVNEEGLEKIGLELPQSIKDRMK